MIFLETRIVGHLIGKNPIVEDARPGACGDIRQMFVGAVLLQFERRIIRSRSPVRTRPIA